MWEEFPLFFFLSLHPKGGSSDAELYDSVVRGGRAKSLRKIHFSGQRNWKKGKLGARERPREKKVGKRESL